MERATFTPKEAAAYIGVSMPTIYALAAREDFPSMRLGKKIIISADGLRQWINRECGVTIEQN